MIVFPPSCRWGWFTSFCAFSLLSLGRMPSCIKKDTESGSSICLPLWMRRWQAELIVSAALHHERDYRWQHRLLIKAGTLKKTEELRSRRTSVSSHQAPTRRLPLSNTAPTNSLYSSSSLYPTPGCQSCREREVTSQEFASSLEAHHVSGSLSCVRLPPGKLWSSPRVCTSRLLAEEGREGGREKINRMFFHLVNWQHRLLERCLSKRSVWKAFRLAEERIGKWKHGELLSLDEVSELLCCFAWVSRKHLRCDWRTSMEECLIKKLWRLRGIISLGWSEYLCLYVCTCVHTVYNYFEHPSSRKL